MIDSGATSTFIHQQFIERNGIITHALFKPIKLRNVDGSPNKAGSLTEWCQLEIRAGDYCEKVNFLVTNLGSEDIILGPWLRKINPTIDWEHGTVEIAGGERISKVELTRKEKRSLKQKGIEVEAADEVWCAATFTYSTELAAKAKGKTTRTFEEMVP